MKLVHALTACVATAALVACAPAAAVPAPAVVSTTTVTAASASTDEAAAREAPRVGKSYRAEPAGDSRGESVFEPKRARPVERSEKKTFGFGGEK